MCCGVVGDKLMTGAGPDWYEEALQVPYAREMDFTGTAEGLYPCRCGMIYIG
jgi:hypothetical protein